MKTVKLYGDYYLVGLHEDKKEFLKDAEKDRTEWGYDGEIKEEYIKDGFLYGDFETEDSYFQGGYTGAVAVDIGLLEIHGKYKDCLYIDFDDVVLASL